jgi:Macrocin-O-methyltransferase (TylF)
MKYLLAKLARMAGYAVFKTRNRYVSDGLYTLHSDRFRRDEAFRAAYARGVQASHGFDPHLEWRAHIALWAAATALRAAGDFIECGVNAGFISSAIMQSLNWRDSGRRFYLIDTFTGPVLSQYAREEIALGRVDAAKSALAAGAYVTDFERVRANFSEWPNAIVVRGVVPEILDTLERRPTAFLHLDMNCALPERAALEYFWDRLSPGGMVLLDDYTYFGHDFQAEAVDEAARVLGIKILALPTGQGLIVKP